MVLQAASDSRAWSAATVDDAQRWYHPLPNSLLAELRAVVAAAPADAPIVDLRLTDSSGRNGPKRWRRC